MYITECLKPNVADLPYSYPTEHVSLLQESISFIYTAWNLMTDHVCPDASCIVADSEEHHGLIARRDAIAFITTMTTLRRESDNAGYNKNGAFCP